MRAVYISLCLISLFLYGPHVKLCVCARVCASFPVTTQSQSQQRADLNNFSTEMQLKEEKKKKKKKKNKRKKERKEERKEGRKKKQAGVAILIPN